MNTARRASVILAVAAALTLSACTGTAGPDGTSAAPAPTPTASQTDMSQITDQPGSQEGYVGALEDAKLTSCERDGANWVAQGTVTNPIDKVQSYRLYVSALSDDDTRGIIQVDVPKVAGGATAEWKASFPLDDEKLECVLRVERFAP